MAQSILLYNQTAELWPNLCEDAGKKEGFFCLSKPMDAFIEDVCRCDHSNQNLMVSNNI